MQPKKLLIKIMTSARYKQYRESTRTKNQLENEKLRLEVIQLKKSIKQTGLQKWLSIIQVVGIVIGVAFGLNEFVFKDKEIQNHRIESTLDYLGKYGDNTISKAEDTLAEYRHLAFTVSNKSKDSLFSAIAQRFNRGTYALSNYYSVLQAGIESGQFDKQLCEAFLYDKLDRHIDILYDLQSQHNGLDKKMVIPGYRAFKGMVDFYLARKGIYEDMHWGCPQYGIQAPFPLPTLPGGDIPHRYQADCAFN
jgi:hypothetical protein